MTTFNPANWMDRAEALGFNVYIWKTVHYGPNGDNPRPEDGINIMSPRGRDRTKQTGDELDLFYNLRGHDDATDARNHDALWDHLEQTGRVVEAAGRSVS